MKIEVDFTKVSQDDIRKLIRMLQAYVSEKPMGEEKVTLDAPAGFAMFDTIVQPSEKKDDSKGIDDLGIPRL